MNWRGFRNRLAANHPGQPQAIARIDLAVAHAESALAELGALGYRYHLAPGPGPQVPDWPRLLFHADAAPNGRVVRSEFEASDLGPGWFDSLEAAQHWDGMQTQFSGRGGVPRAGLPAQPQEKSLLELAAEALASQAEKEQRIAEFKEQRGKAHAK